MTTTKLKKRKVSKKTKRAWRKHVDVKDVDSFLDKKRQDERLGSLVDRKDHELFVIDTENKVLSKKERRELAKSKEPQCFNILKPHSSVPDPISKRNRVKTKEERMSSIVIKKEAIRKARGILKLKEKLSLKDKALAEKKRNSKPKRGEFNVDAWKDSEIKQVDTDWMTSDTVRHTLTHLGLKKKRIPTTLKKKASVLPAIELPHPGTSYNPSFEDHQDLLRMVADEELKLIKEEAHLERVTTKMFNKVSREEQQKNYMEEMSAGLVPEADSGPEDDDPTVKSVNPPAKNMKKTRVQRRKQREEKELARQRKMEKVEKKKVSDLYRLKLLHRQMAKNEKKQTMLNEKRQKQKALKAVETKTLSKVKFEPAEPAFKLSEELSGSLRSSAPGGNLLKDRFKSLQQRNIIAPSTLKLKHNKAKVKRFIKPDHKIDLKKVAEVNCK